MAAQSGPPPTEAMTAPFLLWHPLYHEGGMARPKGGSGMLTQALQKHIEAHGGKVFVNAPVEEILVEGRGQWELKLQEEKRKRKEEGEGGRRICCRGGFDKLKRY